ncbi:DUF2971 domain-containing protein [Vibrio metschnikovii]|uniref:DUF2971 domain-containing protein n=1 Tax=Vibrio metschnikovii TaxID=28172 RepID=UPI001C2F27B7|nr:DUF2971 domain-containing protein [Vibrio metschnikovii]
MNWIEEFLNMIYPLSGKNLRIEQAYILKNNNLPKSIYKYRVVNENSIKNLEEDTIWLADPSSFNDPYDCAHSVDFSRVHKYRNSAFFSEYFEGEGSDIKLNKEQKDEVSTSEDPISYLIDILFSEKTLQQREEFKSIFSDTQNAMHMNMSHQNSKIIASGFKLCSFSERNDSILMWSHYSSYHQGFCIEYDIESIPYSDYRRRFLYPTIYSDEMFDATEHFMRDIDDENFNNLYLSLAALIKARDWEYEKEWRLVFANSVFEKERAYKMGKPKMVYLGAKIGQLEQEKLLEICSRREIPVKKMRPKYNSFTLEPVSVNEADQSFFKEA